VKSRETSDKGLETGRVERGPRRVAVIGGGISGLAAAHRLHELAPECELSLLEAGSRLGGALDTTERDGFIVERGSDSFITNTPWALDLCRRIGIDSELVSTNPAQRTTLVVRRGRLAPVPEGFLLMRPTRLWPLVTSPVLSWAGKLRLLGEALVPRRRKNADESLESFARRRLGRETFERLVQPLVGGIYTADPARLSLAATLPRFLEMEREHGSLIRAALRERRDAAEQAASGARFSLFVTPRRGLSSLVEAIAARLPAGAVRLNTPVQEISRSGPQWDVHRPGGRERFDAVVLAAPAPAAAAMLAQSVPDAADPLGQIEYAGAAVVITAHHESQFDRPAPGFGFVTPAVERRQVLAVSYSSVKFPARAPQGTRLIRSFLGGALQPELMRLPDDELRRIVLRELRELAGLRGEPLFTEIARWDGKMPQYHVGHLDRVAKIEAAVARQSGLELAGNAYHGVGIPQCVRSGEQAAERIVRWFAGER